MLLSSPLVSDPFSSKPLDRGALIGASIGASIGALRSGALIGVLRGFFFRNSESRGGRGNAEFFFVSSVSGDGEPDRFVWACDCTVCGYIHRARQILLLLVSTKENT